MNRIKHIRNLFIELLFLIIIILNSVIFNNHDLLSSIIILFALIVSFYFFHDKEDIIFFVAAVFLGLMMELISVHSNVWFYTNPLFLGIPFWLPFAWGFSFLIARRLRHTLFSGWGAKVDFQDNLKNVEWSFLYDISMFFLFVLIGAYLWHNNNIVFFLFVLLLFTNIALFHTKEDLFFVFFSAIIGPFVDSLWIYHGVFAYSNPSWPLNIPFWLPVAYAYFALIVRRISSLFVNLLDSEA